MTVNKIPLCPDKIRRVPEQFNWVDHRLVRERYIDYLSNEAAALYLFLVTVSDARGLSYYGDTTLQKRLGMHEHRLVAARGVLIEQGLIASANRFTRSLPWITAGNRVPKQPGSLALLGRFSGR
jgi:hypothetical protein